MSALTVRCLARGAFCIALLSSVGACRTVAESYSPWTEGFGIKVAPELMMGDSDEGPTIHPAFSYTRIANSNWVEVGAQIRWPASIGGNEMWGGFEAMVGRSGSTGVTGSALIGFPFSDSRWQPSAYVSAGLSRYGNTGKVLSAGVDLQPWFLKR